ncbi:hypothetical protein T484DRAFT_2871893 [Baffinella frigidus]|nr:hypothetical protein T484DRAFT_2871893 [Cryptophyta sp. CCMP2293]
MHFPNSSIQWLQELLRRACPTLVRSRLWTAPPLPLPLRCAHCMHYHDSDIQWLQELPRRACPSLVLAVSTIQGYLARKKPPPPRTIR